MKYTQEQASRVFDLMQNLIQSSDDCETFTGSDFSCYGWDDGQENFTQLDMGSHGSVRVELREQVSELDEDSGDWVDGGTEAFWMTDFSDTDGGYPSQDILEVIERLEKYIEKREVSLDFKRR